MVETARFDARRTSGGAACHRTDVCPRHLPATDHRRHQPHHRAHGGTTEILDMLAWTIYISFIGVAVLMLLPRGNARAARGVALLTAVIGLVIALTAIAQATPGEIHTVTKLSWVPSLGFEY